MSFTNFEEMRLSITAISRNIQMIQDNTTKMLDEIWHIKNEHWSKIVNAFHRLYLLANEIKVEPSLLRIKLPKIKNLDPNNDYYIALSKTTDSACSLGIYKSSSGNAPRFIRWVSLYTSLKYVLDHSGLEEQNIINAFYDNWDFYEEKIQEGFFDNASAVLNQRMDEVAKKSLEITQRLKEAQTQKK